MNVFIISLATVVIKLCGGLFALKFKDKLHLVLGFSAGTLLGVALFDLLPESLELGQGVHEPHILTGVVALGFLIYLIVDRIIAAHDQSGTKENIDCGHSHHHGGTLGALTLIVHSFLDGLAIGLAFQVSVAVGTIVATAVMVHGFSDGINTVSLALRGGGSRRAALNWLALGAVAPALGALSTLFFSLKEDQLALVLALFAGFFLYIGASDLLPESHHRHPTPWTTLTTVLGMCVIYIAITLAG